MFHIFICLQQRVSWSTCCRPQVGDQHTEAPSLVQRSQVVQCYLVLSAWISATKSLILNHELSWMLLARTNKCSAYTIQWYPESQQVGGAGEVGDLCAPLPCRNIQLNRVWGHTVSLQISFVDILLEQGRSSLLGNQPFLTLVLLQSHHFCIFW